MSQTQSLLLTVTATAQLLGVSRWTVSDMCRRFELRWIPWRGSRIHKRIPRAEVDRYIKEHMVGDRQQLLAATDRRRSQ